MVLVLSAAGPAARAVEESTPLRTFRTFDRDRYADAPSQTIRRFAQDRRGVLWILDYGNVTSFDGLSFGKPSADPSAPSQGQALGIAARSSGGIYATSPKGLSIWNEAEWHLIPLPGARDVAQDVDGSSWVRTEDGVLFGCDEGERRCRPVRGLPKVTGLAGATRTGAWVWADAAAYHVSRTGQVTATLTVARNSVHGEPIVSAVAAPDGSFWGGTRDGAIVHGTAGATELMVVERAGCSAAVPKALAVDPDGTLWVGDNGGSLCFGREGKVWRSWGPSHGLRASGINAIFFDADGSLWIGYAGYGIQQWITPQWTHRNRWRDDEPFPGRVSVTDIAGTHDGFVATVYQKGLWRWDGERMHRYGPSEGLTGSPFAAAEPAVGTLWVGAAGGLFESTGGRRFEQVLKLQQPGAVTGFFRSPDGRDFLATTTAGVFERRRDGWRPADTINRNLLGREVRKLLWLRNGELWVGTKQGIAIFGDGKVRQLAADGTRLPSTVNDLLVVGDEVWIAGSGGVSIESPRGRRFLSEEDGLPGAYAAALGLDPKGDVWVLGATGVSRVARAGTIRWGAGTGLLEAQGVLGSLWIDRDGSVLVGTMGGLSRFDPRSHPLRPPPAPTVHWLPGSGLTAPRQGHWRWFSPRLLPGELEYRVRVPGLYDAWSQSQKHSELVLPELPSGRWRIEVAASAVDGGTWGESLVERFEVAPYVYETPLAFGFYVGAGALFVGAAVRLRTRHLRRRTAELDEQVALRTAQLAEAFSELEEANSELERLARTDALTGLANRASFTTTLAREWERATRGGRSIALVLGDVDHFKLYNDRYGHPAGDRCLQTVAAVLSRSSRRAADLAARCGGEEFALVLPETDVEGAIQSAERVLAELAADRLPHEASPVCPYVTMSLGIAVATPSPGSSPSGLIELADQSLYRAKHDGRNRWRIAESVSLGDAPEPKVAAERDECPGGPDKPLPCDEVAAA